MNKCPLCGFIHDNSETCEQVGKRVASLMEGINLIHSGYAGVSASGGIVDRRQFPNATPMPENTLLGAPKPKDIK